VSSYPVAIEIDYVERRSRLTTFFRLILLIPLLIVAFFYVLAAEVVVIIAWFVLLFTARWPEGLYKFTVGVLRFRTRVFAYGVFACDPYPPFGLEDDPGYPVRLHADPPLERYSRLKILFRIFYVIPAAIVVYVLNILIEFVAIADWVVIVIIGRQLPGLQSVVKFVVTYDARAYALLFLVTQTYPPFETEPAVA
jgi:uncharacterized protein DUF4389